MRVKYVGGLFFFVGSLLFVAVVAGSLLGNLSVFRWSLVVFALCWSIGLLLRWFYPPSEADGGKDIEHR